ncbi:HD domain-containing protein, partial [bacterium]|nr:HD domain-containing protein [bacterium]
MCWNVALVAVLLHGEVEDKPDLGHVLAMIAAHDLVEIEAGDTFAYDSQGSETKVAREQAAAERIFGLLPEAQARQLRELWDEYESAQTAEARFALSLDRL